MKGVRKSALGKNTPPEKKTRKIAPWKIISRKYTPRKIAPGKIVLLVLC